MTILDQFGRPIDPSRPRVDAATVSNVRPSDRIVASGMTPERLGRILREANGGALEELLILAEEMEERDLHYYSVLQTRKLSVAGANVRIEMTGEPDEALIERVQDAVVNAPWFRGALLDALDALGKGYSVLQPFWRTSARGWDIERVEHVDPRCFTFDADTQRELRLRDQKSADEGRPLPAGQFVVHYPHLRSCVPARGGLARIAVVTWMFKHYTIQDWVRFAEVYGMPLRLGKYDPATATAADKAALRRALASIGHDAAALLPHGMEIEIDALNSRASGTGDLFLDMAEYFDKQMSKAILGQTMTTDDGSSLAQAQVHERQGNKLFEHDAHQLSNTATLGFVRPWVYFNVPNGEEIAKRMRVVVDVRPAEDVKAFTDAVLPWVEKTKIPVSLTQIRSKLGLVAPESAADTLEIPEPEPAPAPGAPGAKPGTKSPTKPKIAANAISAEAVVQETERLAEHAAADWEVVMGPFRETLEELGKQARDYDHFLRLLAKHYADRVDADPLVRRLAIEMTKVHALAEST